MIECRGDFPELQRTVHSKPLVYLDNAATTQKPLSVIQETERYYSMFNANVHRGVHQLSQEATLAYELTREKVKNFIGAGHTKEVIFTRGATEALNIVANCLGEDLVQANDSIVVTRMEHHSNFVPWQTLAFRKKALFKIVELTDDFRIDMKSWATALQSHPKIVAFTWMSNVLGTVNPVKQMAEEAKRVGAIVVVDATQGVTHYPFQLSDLGPVDFIVFSAHKMYGPTGVGVLWGREKLLNEMRPYQYGGNMILQVRDDVSEYNELPYKFEAGTPNMAGVIAFGTALDFIERIGREDIQKYEETLTEYALDKMTAIPGLRIIGPSSIAQRGAVISFELEGVHPHDLAQFLDQEGIAVRAGHHCAQPLLTKIGCQAVTRASFGIYNNRSEVDVLVEALRKSQRYFNK